MPSTAEVVKTKPNENTLPLAAEKKHFIYFIFFSVFQKLRQALENTGGWIQAQTFLKYLKSQWKKGSQERVKLKGQEQMEYT